jgi:DNA-binding transcriptional LysR family regulator
MSKAAKELGFVQSHITGRIKLLEQEAQQALFERTKTGVSLTPEGQKFYPYAESLLAQWNQTRSVLLQSEEPVGRLRIGSMETTAALHAARWISEYHASCPNVEISLVTGTTRELLHQILDRKLDVAFVAGSVEHPDIASKPIVVEQMQIITAKNLTLDDILRVTPVAVTFRAGCTYRRLLESWLTSMGITLLNTMECASIDTILQLVAGGLGISMMPKAVLEQSRWRQQLSSHDLKGDMGLVTTYAIWRDLDYLSRPLSVLLTQLEVVA